MKILENIFLGACAVLVLFVVLAAFMIPVGSVIACKQTFAKATIMQCLFLDDKLLAVKNGMSIPLDVNLKRK